MASFTDQIIAFNPYVEQVPVDDYVRVGMIKQTEYNQGVEKVQAYIDSVAGLEVIKPEQRDYLQQRVGQLQNEVSKIVQRDFSNQQLQNSVGNLTKRIAKDPIIESAVASTQRYKAGVAAMKAAQEKGESGPSNEWYFQDQFQKWYNDKDVRSTFNGSYTKFTDVNKKVMEAIKVVTGDPNITTEDIPYKRDNNGAIQMDSSGLPIIDYAMMEKTTKGVTPERIEAAIRASLDQNDLRQLSIDGMYTYRGADKNGLKQITDASYQSKLNQINDTIKGLLVDRQTNINDPDHIKNVDSKIESLKSLAENYQNRYKRDIGALDSNPEGFKSELYLENYLSRFGDGYSYAQNSLTYKENPFFMAAERRRENDIRYQEFLINKQFQAANLALAYEKLALDKEELRLKREAAAKDKKAASDGLPLSDAVPGAIDQGLVEAINVDTYVAETETIGSQIDTQKMALLAQLRPDLVHIVRSPDGLQKRYEYNVAGKDSNAVKSEAEATILKLKDSYDKGETVDDGAKTYFDQLANADQSIQNRRFALGKLYHEADVKYDISQFTGRVAPITVTLPDGKQSRITTDQMIRINNKLNSIRNLSPGQGADLFVTPEEKYIYNAYRKSAQGLPGITAPLTPGEQQALAKVREVSNLTSSAPVRQTVDAKNTYLNNTVRDIVGVTQPTAFTIEAFKAEDRNRAKAVANVLLNDIATRGVSNESLPGSPEFNEKKFARMLEKANQENTTYSLEVKGAGQYALKLSNPDIDREGQEVSLTTQQANSLFGEKAFLDDFQRIRESLQLSKATGRVTTDVQGLGKESAFKLNNGNINNYGVKYHVEDPLKNGGLQLRLYIFDKTNKEWTEKPVSFGALLNEAQVTRALSGLTDEAIKEIIERKK